MAIVAARLARRELRTRPVDLVVVDLSGRAIAEFLTACMVAARRERPVLWLVAHDPPELVGPPLLFAQFDRRGARRVGMFLSNTLGRWLEGWLLRRTDVLLAFSEAGAVSLRDRKLGTKRVVAIPLPTERIAPRNDDVVYCPSSVTFEELQPVLDAFASGAVAPPTRLRVGSLSAADARRVEALCATLNIAERVELTGFLDQAALDASFATAAVVVRSRIADANAANWAAASGPLMSALAAGCAVVGTDARGSARCLELAGINAVSTREMVETLARVVNDPEQLHHLGEAASAHVEACHVPEAVAGHLRAIWADGPSPTQ
jgi:hypothetical protein